MFKDRVAVEVHSGNGGNGCVSFRREKYVPRGGPDGGDGGRGGSVKIGARADMLSLEGIRNRSVVKAGTGGDGTSRKCRGRSGKDVKILVPVGTRVIDEETEDIIADLVRDGDEKIICKGGEGGAGNVHFASSRNQAPRQFETGKPGESRSLVLDYRAVADAAFIGFPATGKTRLVCRLANADYRGGNFSYSTRNPSIKIAKPNPYTHIRLLDMPSIETGASEGKGIGWPFCKHLLRPAFLVATLDASRYDIPLEKQAAALKEEAERCVDFDLQKGRRWVYAVAKRDLVSSEDAYAKTLSKLKKKGTPVFETDAASGAGIDGLLAFFAEALEES